MMEFLSALIKLSAFIALFFLLFLVFCEFSPEYDSFEHKLERGNQKKKEKRHKNAIKRRFYRLKQYKNTKHKEQ